MEDAMEESAKGENEVMGDDSSSAAEEIGVPKDLGGGWLPHEWCYGNYSKSQSYVSP